MLMREQTLRSSDFSDLHAGALGQRVTPFDDIAAVHALYHARIYRFLLLSLRDRDVALSLTQDTFLNAWKARESFRGDCGVATWLMRIAVNLLRTHTRTERFKFWKAAGVTAVDADDPALQLRQRGASAEGSLLAQERLAQVWDVVEGLSEKQRGVFLLRFVEELELSEIAEALEMHVPTVKSHLHRALEHVRTAMRIEGRQRENGKRDRR